MKKASEIEQELTKLANKYLEMKMSLHNKFSSAGTYVDLHGFFAYEATIVVERMIDTTMELLRNGTVEPNFDEHNHLLKIIAGAGHHSRNGGVLKKRISELIQKKGYDHKYFEQNGVIMVRYSN